MPFLLFLLIFWYWKKNITYEVSIILSYKREKSRFPVEQKVFDAKKKRMNNIREVWKAYKYFLWVHVVYSKRFRKYEKSCHK